MTVDISLYPDTVTAFDGNEQRATVFLDRYALKDATGKPVERFPEEMHQRVAVAIGSTDDQAQRFQDLLSGFKFVPGGRILAGAGTGTEVTFYNCLAAGTLVHTDEGVVPIETLVGQTVHIKTEDGVSRPASFHSYGEQPLLRVTLEDGEVFEATPGHEWSVTKPLGGRETVLTGDLVGRRIPVVPPSKPPFSEDAIAWGIVFGDGTLNPSKSAVHLLGEKVALGKHLPRRDGITRTHREDGSLYVYGMNPDWKTIPSDDDEPGVWAGFIVGLLATDGSVDSRGSVVISQSDRSVLEAIKRNAGKAGFVAGSIRVLRIDSNLGDYAPNYGLNIYRSTLDVSDFIRDDQRKRFLSRSTKTATVKVVSVEATGRVEEVFCCNEPVTHTMVIGQGYLTRQCYVIPIETKVRRQGRMLPDGWDVAGAHINVITPSDPGNDSREAIFDTIGLMVDIMSRGGGVGINWSVLRPKGAYLKRVNGSSSGPVGWMDVASKAVGEVEQGGSRRGAAMFMLDDWHPDVLGFIEAKRDYARITNANVSVAVSDDFMLAVENDDFWGFYFPDTSHAAYNTEWDGDILAWEKKGYPVIDYGRRPAREIWRKLAESAWASGEPGVVFLDRYNKLSTAQSVERLISVNPCGEQGLGAYSVCNLGAMNLNAYVAPRGDGRVDFDWVNFGIDVQTAIEFLDRVIDENYYFLPENERIQKRLRRVGLSVMGLADVLIRLGIRYGSAIAAQFTETVFDSMKLNAISASVQLAEGLGQAPAWEPEMVDRPYLASLKDRSPDIWEDLNKHGLRNLFLLSQAPTGTTSILAGVNSGIEPLFALGYWREDRTGKHWVEPKVVSDMKADWVRQTGQHENDMPSFVSLVTAADVSVGEHIDMQAAVQQYVDSSVSKTINAPNEQTVDETEMAFTMAYEAGLKGLAYFRDGSGRQQVLYTDKGTYNDGYVAGLILENEELLSRLIALEGQQGEFTRPDTLSGRTTKVRTTAGTAYVTVNRDDDGRPVEVFISIGKSGQNIMEMGEAMGRLASLALRKGANLGGVANQLDGIGGTSPFFKSLPAAVSGVLTAENPQAVIRAPLTQVPDAQADSPRAITGDACPDCSAMSVIREEGCLKCHACGWSAC